MVLPRAVPSSRAGLPRRAPSRPRTALATLVAVVLLAAVGLGTGPATPPASAGENVCPGATAKNGSSQVEDVRAGERLLGRVWVHLLKGGGSCTVLRAVAYKGTPHYMAVQVCRISDQPYDCSGTDAGRYRTYAGPIVHHADACQMVRVKIDVPRGRRLTDQWVHFACD